MGRLRLSLNVSDADVEVHAHDTRDVLRSNVLLRIGRRTGVLYRCRYLADWLGFELDSERRLRLGDYGDQGVNLAPFRLRRDMGGTSFRLRRVSLFSVAMEATYGGGHAWWRVLRVTAQGVVVREAGLTDSLGLALDLARRIQLAEADVERRAEPL